MVREDGIGRSGPLEFLPSEQTPTPLHKVVAMQQVGAQPGTYWYSGGGRALFAEEVDGRWRLIEYIFPEGRRLFHLRWAAGKPIRLWSSERERPPPSSSTSLHNIRLLEITFPPDEIELLETIMHEVPHNLWARLIKLALEAHFTQSPFPQRRVERPPAAMK